MNQTFQRDAKIGKMFYDLLPPESFGIEPGMPVNVNIPDNSPHFYDKSEFPESIGPSWTFSVWSKASFDGAEGMMIAKQPSAENDEMCWGVHACLPEFMQAKKHVWVHSVQVILCSNVP